MSSYFHIATAHVKYCSSSSMPDILRSVVTMEQFDSRHGFRFISTVIMMRYLGLLYREIQAKFVYLVFCCNPCKQAHTKFCFEHSARPIGCDVRTPLAAGAFEYIMAFPKYRFIVITTQNKRQIKEDKGMSTKYSSDRIISKLDN